MKDTYFVQRVTKKVMKDTYFVQRVTKKRDKGHLLCTTCYQKT